MFNACILNADKNTHVCNAKVHLNLFHDSFNLLLIMHLMHVDMLVNINQTFTVGFS